MKKFALIYSSITLKLQSSEPFLTKGKMIVFVHRNVSVWFDDTKIVRTRRTIKDKLNVVDYHKNNQPRIQVIINDTKAAIAFCF